MGTWYQFFDFAAAAVHGIKADVLAVGDFRIQPRRHGFALPGQNRGHFPVPLLAVRLDALRGQARPFLDRGIVEAEFHHGKIRGGGLQIIPQAERGQPQLHLVELLEAGPEMHQHQIALVAEQRENRAAGFFDFRQHGRGLGDQFGLRLLAERPPGGPADAQHLVQHARAFDGQGRRRQSGRLGGVFDHSVVPHFNRLVQGRVSGSS